jgi:hypothetical protein
MAKPGRPKSAEPREMVVSLRLTHAEYHQLRSLSIRKGVSIGEFVRRLVLANMPPNPPKDLEG